MMVFLFCKRLQNSDVNNVGRIVLPKVDLILFRLLFKRSAEIHLPRLLDHESFMLPVLDMDGGAAWSFKYRYWPNNVSRMYVFEGTGPFIRKYGLQTGDYMLMYKDMVTWNYMIRGVKASEAEGHANQETTATEGNMDNLVLNDNAAGNDDAVENGVVAEVGAFDLPDVSDNFLKAESIAGTSFMNDDDSYFSDILNSFSSWDEIKDYYYSPTQPNVTSDNLSSKDLSQVQVRKQGS
ncbi:putative transcription factor B3-Domain family [Helianthus anomalus]